METTARQEGADAVDAAVDKVVDAGGAGVVVVEGLLLLGSGAERVRDRCAQLVLLDDGYDDPAKQEVLWRRKWTRTGHLAKTSYQQRGVTADEFAAYWGDCVSARWKEHGLDRVEAAGRPISNFRFLRYFSRRPPVSRRLCLPSRVIPCKLWKRLT